MDPEVLVLVRDAERELRRLLTDLAEPADWESRARSLLALQAIAATLVDASRRYAEHLAQEAGRLSQEAGRLSRSDDPESPL